MADAADRHHPRAGDRQHVVQQQPGEREVAEVVGAELQLEAVLRWSPSAVYITPALLISRSMRGWVARSSSAAVRTLSSDVRSSSCTVTSALGLVRRDAVGCLLALVEVAHRQHDVRTLVGEHGGGLEAEAGVGAGHDRHPAGLVGHVGRGPLPAHGLNILSDNCLAPPVSFVLWVPE